MAQGFEVADGTPVSRAKTDGHQPGLLGKTDTSENRQAHEKGHHPQRTEKEEEDVLVGDDPTTARGDQQAEQDSGCRGQQDKADHLGKNIRDGELWPGTTKVFEYSGDHDGPILT
jgi:hypothetical protein